MAAPGVEECSVRGPRGNWEDGAEVKRLPRKKCVIRCNSFISSSYNEKPISEFGISKQTDLVELWTFRLDDDTSRLFFYAAENGHFIAAPSFVYSSQ